MQLEIFTEPEVGELKWPRQNNFHILKSNNYVRDRLIFSGKVFVGSDLFILFSVGE